MPRNIFRRKEPTELGPQRTRMRFVSILVAMAFVGIMARAWFVQVHQNDKYKAYWSLKPNEQKDSYLPAEIAWYSLNEPSEYLPAHSQILKGKMIGDYHLAIQGVSKNRHSLTSLAHPEPSSASEPPHGCHGMASSVPPSLDQ